MKRTYFFITGILTMLLCGCAPDGEKLSKKDFPSVLIENGEIKVTVYLPDEKAGFYRGCRFDWSGQLKQVELDGHTYFSHWREVPHNPDHPHHAIGVAEEFDLMRPGDAPPPGYKEAKSGETFLKVGVGLLRKSKEEPYNYRAGYEIVTPGKWQVTRTRDSMSFTQTLVLNENHSYRYVKELKLVKGKPEMVITRTLKNTGRKDMDCTQYSHNFFVIDHTPTGECFNLTTPYKMVEIPPENKSREKTTRIDGSRLTFTRTLNKGEAFLADAEGFSDKPEDNSFTLRNTETGAGVTASVDQSLLRFQVYGTRNVIAPEAFVKLRIKSGESKTWTTRYTFHVEKKR